MATIEEALFTRLTEFAETAALLGTRVYPLAVPQDAAMPALAYQRISGSPAYSHDGFSNLSRARFQMTCQADTYARVKALAAAVRHCWDGFKGTVEDIDLVAFIENELDSTSEAPVVRLDVRLLHNATD